MTVIDAEARILCYMGDKKLRFMTIKILEEANEDGNSFEVHIDDSEVRCEVRKVVDLVHLDGPHLVIVDVSQLFHYNCDTKKLN